jgi:hypothetical protein
MEKIPDIGNYQIILLFDNADDLSEDWQDQCKYFYSEISRLLPEGLVKPLSLEINKGRKAFDFVSFSHLVLTDFFASVLASVFVEAFIVAFKNWSEYSKDATVKLHYPDGSMIEISEQLLSKLRNFSNENPQLSTFEVLNYFRNLKK